MRFAFLLPPGSGPGTRYARCLGAALRAAGHEAEVSADDAGPDAVPVLDGALLPRPVPPGAIALLHRVPNKDWQPAAFRALIATSPAILQRLDEGGARASLIVPGVCDLPRSTGSGESGCAILAVGTITVRKGYATLLRALGRLADLDWTLSIAGSTAQAPEHAPTIAALADELGLARRVRLILDPDDAALEALWRGADLFALASEWEGYAAALAEALRRGLPAAVSDTAAAALPPLAGSSWGAACAAGDVEGLSKAMRRLIYDRALRAALANGAWQAGQTLPSWDAQARRFVTAIEEAS
ncbi:MAG: glycosyltransferase [Acetobacteraceae bacterium]|nr:glycosyltransferase [Acetobacteraceae bacterium]